MPKFYVQKNMGDAASAVTAGVFGKIVPEVDNPGGFRFHADPIIERCSSSLSFGLDGQGVRMTGEDIESKYIEIDVAENIANAIKANLMVAMGKRWAQSYDFAFPRVRNNEVATQMLQAEKSRALNGIKTGIESMTDVVLKAVALNYKSVTLYSSNDDSAPSVNIASNHVELALPLCTQPVDDVVQHEASAVAQEQGRYEVIANVPMYLPQVGNSITRRFNFIRGAQTEREAALAPQIEEMLRIMTGSLVGLAMPIVTTEMLDWSKANLMERFTDSDDEFDEDDEDDEDDDASDHQFERHGM